MNREDKIASRVAGYSASGYYKSLAGWTSTVMKKARLVDRFAPSVLSDLQDVIDDSNKNRTMRNLGYLEGILDELIKDATDMKSVVVDAGKAVRQHTS